MKIYLKGKLIFSSVKRFKRAILPPYILKDGTILKEIKRIK